MKNVKTVAFIFLMASSYVSMAQKLTTPQAQGIETGSKITVSFPFTITGVPFSQIPGSVWNANAHVVVEMYMSYYMEGDPKQYSNTRKLLANPKSDGGWRFTNLYIEPKPYDVPGRKMVEGKTFYSIFIYQQKGNERSSSWNAEIKRSKVKIIDIPSNKLEPKTTPPIQKIILNPQPIPPKTDKKLIRTKG